ncbi:COG4705 family protein [Kribbella sp. NPDC055110]
MTTTTASRTSAGRVLLNKVPEVTIWFWLIKILCTTVGESFADWINMQLGVGLVATAVIFTVVFAAVLTWQVKTTRYRPAAYWATVVVVSVTGTLYTDILTDQLGVPLWISTSVFAVALAVVFGIWWARERTLSIHSIVSRPREAFYWLAVLVTFALGTAAGDWTLELTGWSPGVSVLLPLALIAIIIGCWRMGANPVLAFWLAYILTRPLGANLGDWLASPKVPDKGLGLGTLVTSLIFLSAILATVVYLTVTKSDVIESHEQRERKPKYHQPRREWALVGVMAASAIAAGVLLNWASAQPHANAAAEGEGPNPAEAGVHMTSAQATAHFPKADVAQFRTLIQSMNTDLAKGDQAALNTSVSAYEKAWDDDEEKLKPLDSKAWAYIDSQNDGLFTSVRETKDPAAEKTAIQALHTTLG